jgi:hypothetical protein
MRTCAANSLSRPLLFRRARNRGQIRGLGVAALSVSPIPDDQIALKTIFTRSRWKWDGVPTIEKARSWWKS